MYLFLTIPRENYACATIQLPANKPVILRYIINEVIVLDNPCAIAPNCHQLIQVRPSEDPNSDKIINGLRPIRSLSRPMYR